MRKYSEAGLAVVSPTHWVPKEVYGGVTYTPTRATGTLLCCPKPVTTMTLFVPFLLTAFVRLSSASLAFSPVIVSSKAQAVAIAQADPLGGALVGRKQLTQVRT